MAWRWLGVAWASAVFPYWAIMAFWLWREKKIAAQKKLAANSTRGGRAPGSGPLRPSGVLQPQRAFHRGRDGEEQRQDFAAGGRRGAAGGDHAIGARGALIIPATAVCITCMSMF